jgi:hypothetical protein
MQDNWLQLGPEVTPGTFGVLAYDPVTLAAMRITLDFTKEKGLKVRDTVSYDFPLKLYGGDWERIVSISPTWHYIGYVEADLSGTSTTTPPYTIYSTGEERSIWTTDLQGNIASVVWAVDPQFVGAVILRGNDSYRPIVLVTADGQKSDLLDLRKLPIQQPFIVSGSRLMSVDGKLALLIGAQGDRLNARQFVLDIRTGQIVEYCVAIANTFLSIDTWVDDGKYLSIIGFDTQTGLSAKVILLEAATGDYVLYDLEQGQIPLAWGK